MTPESFRSPIDAFQAQLREALETHVSALTQQYDQAIAEARRAATAAAEQDIATRLEAVEVEWKSRLESEIAAARTEAQRHLAAEVAKVRVEAEQQTADTLSRGRQELEAALAAERQRAESLVKEERQRAQSELDRAQREARETAERLDEAMRARAQAEQARAQAEERARTHADAQSAAQAELARRTAELQQKPKTISGSAITIVEGLRAIDKSRTLTEALGTVLRHTSSIVPRAVIFLINGERLKSWKSVGFPQFEAQPFESAITGVGLLAHAIQTSEAIATGPSQPPPTFAAVPGDLAALAVPMIVGGRAVALVYADNAGNSEIAPAWRDTVESLVRHASTHLALLTAMRTVQAIGTGAPVGTGGAVRPEDSHDQSARRYARLLVSEIKLYNEAAVRTGRQQRDLLRRLRPEIERARRLYEERISAAVGARGAYFQQELVQTLADGDPALLGNA